MLSPPDFNDTGDDITLSPTLAMSVVYIILLLISFSCVFTDNDNGITAYAPILILF